MVHPESIIISVALIIPALIQLRYYKQLRAANYLYLSLFLFFLTINVMTNEFITPSKYREIVNILSLSLLFYYLLLVLENTTDQNIPISPLIRRLVLIGYGYTFAVIYIIVDFSDELNSLVATKILVEELIQALVGGLVFLTYKQIKLVLKTPRLIRIKRTWQALGLVMIIAAMLRVMIYGLIILRHTMGNEPYTDLVELQDLGSLVVNLGLLLIGVTILIIALIYPESMLITEYQISKVTNLYNIFKTQPDLSDFDAKTIVDRDFLISYLRDVASKVEEIKPLIS